MFECDECGEEVDPDDEVESEFAIIEQGQVICALCNSDSSE